MIAYIFRRLGVLSVILFGSSFILFNLAAISGDPLEGLRTSTEPNAKQQILNLTRELQLDVPPPLRYFLWLKGILGVFTGNIDFGKTRDAQLVTSAISTAIPTTIRLVFLATITAIVLGITIGIITALRQYSRFDYAMTFVSFLMFSLPIFWVAVLLKEFLAIQFNNFLANPQIPLTWIIGLSVVNGVIWAAIVSGSRRRVQQIFVVVAVGTAALLTVLSLTSWFAKPGLGPIFVFAISIGIAFGVTQLSTGLQNKSALRSSQVMAVICLLLYYPNQWLFDHHASLTLILGLLMLTIVIAIVVGLNFAKIDRGPTVRTAIISGFLMGLIILLDRYMQTWYPYMSTDAINYRPIPTTGQVNPLLEPGNFWFSSLDILVHMILPTIALTLISFAGYIRYSRGTLLEVLNQDYIRTARAKGLNERTVIMRHAFRNTMIPLTTIMVVDFAGLIGGAIITERVFGWIGMGTLFNQAINTFDLNLLMAVFFITASLSVFANLVADLLYSALDPRIRAGKG
jgi:peptide/nickel transport system permease protein